MWSELAQRTNGLRGPHLFSPPYPAPIDFHEISLILQGARDALGSTKLNFFRAYVEGREDYDLARRFLQLEDLSDRRIEDTISQVFHPQDGSYGKNAGLIVNGGLQWSHSAHECLESHAEALRKTASGSITLDVTLFIGSYGATPFGAHIDDSTHRTIIFNLGPGIKELKIWPRQAIENKFGLVRNIIYVTKIHVASSKFIIRPGDAFVLPADEFHVAYNYEVSTAAALVLDHVSNTRLAEREMLMLRHDLHEMEPISEIWQLKLERLATMGHARSRSNGYLRYAPPKIMPAIQDLRRSSVIRIDPRWPVITEQVGSSTLVYARNRHFFGEHILRATQELVRIGYSTLHEFLGIVIADGGELTMGLRTIEFLLAARGANVE